MNSKKAITLLVLATLIMGMLPVVSVNAAIAYGNTQTTKQVNIDTGDYGDTIEVIGSGVTGGYAIELYWDSVQAWDGTAGLLNTTNAKASGAFTVWFDVPSAKSGTHYLWVKDVTTGDTVRSIDGFVVYPRVKPSVTSGLVDDKLDVAVYGFAKKDDVVLMLATATGTYPAVALAGNKVTTAEAVNTTDADGLIDNQWGTLDNLPVRPTTVVVTVGTQVFDDVATHGILQNAANEDKGTINYVTGELEFDIIDVSAATAVTAVYEHYTTDEVSTVYVFDDELTTNDLGYATKSVTIPAVAKMAAGSYVMLAYSEDGTVYEKAFTIGAVISLSVDEGPTGTKVTVTGRGFEDANDIDEYEIVIVDNAVTTWGHSSAVAVKIKGEPIDISDTEWSADIYIPTVDKTGNYEIMVKEATGGQLATDGFEVTGLPGVTVATTHGVSGETLTISGTNYTAESGIDVEFAVFADPYTINLYGGAKKHADAYRIENDTQKVALFAQSIETDSNGAFTGTVTLPAVPDENYQIVAYQDGYNIYGDDEFRVSLMVVVLSKQSGPTGTSVTMTGSGFEGKANATIGDETLFGESTGTGSFSQVVYIPTLDVGMQTIIITDETSEIAVEVEFEITETTYLVIDPLQAPVSSGADRYNMSIEGYYYTREVASKDLTVVLFNVSADGKADDSWTLDVNHMWDDNPASAVTNMVERDVILNTLGNFSGYFDILASTEMGLGTYWVNVTDDGDLFAQISFELVSETETIANKDDVYTIGDVVAFDISNSFSQDDSYIKIMSPNGDLYWRTEALDDAAGNDHWISSGDQVMVPHYLQVSNGQLMELAADAPLGTWSWTWYESDADEIESGTFAVEAAAESVIGGQVDDLKTDIDALVDDIAALAGEIIDYSSEFDSVQDDIAAVADLAADAVAAAEAAADAVTSVASVAGDAASAAADAAEAATAAKDAATGLTTLVYGAIGAALVAALAAIVSLMQISRRIAG